MEKEKLCLRCMRKIGDNNYCPYCRNENNEPQKAPYLPLKTIVGERYLVGKLIESNSEGSTYYAFDYQRKTPVTLRELYPKDLVSRGENNYCIVNVGKVSAFVDAKDSFKKLWQKVSGLGGFNALVPVYDIIEDLGTVFVVFEYLGEGKTLREYLLENEQGYISWDEARTLFMPVLSALGELHSNGIIHGGISPTNLIVDKNGKLRITGYCIEAVRRQKSEMDAEIYDGYAAVEQYGFSGGLTPATDIYAFAAVLYRALIGSVPMSAASRLTNDKLMIPGKFAEMLPAYVINALVNALQILPDERTNSCEVLRDELSASPTAAVNAAEAYTSMYAEPVEDDVKEAPVIVKENVQEEISQKSRLKKSTIAAFVISVILCLAILVTVFIGLGGFGENEKPEENEQTTGEITSTAPQDNSEEIISINTPDFKGKTYEEIKNDETYKSVFTFYTSYVESKEDKGVVIKQNITAGTMVSSLNKRDIVLTISDGLKIPSVEGMSMSEAVDELKNQGFKNVKTEAAQIASSADASLKVYSVVYEDAETGKWSPLPDDRHLSASDKLIVYYYGEFVEETAETTEETTEEMVGDVNTEAGETDVSGEN